MAVLTSRTASLPTFSLHDAAFVLSNEEPEANLSHAAENALRALQEAVQGGELKAHEALVAIPRGGGYGITVEDRSNRRRRSIHTLRPSPDSNPEPASPRDLIVTREELSRWAKGAGYRFKIATSDRSLDDEPIPHTKRAYLVLINALAELANIDISKPYAAEAVVTRHLEMAGRKFGKTFIGDTLKAAHELYK